MKLRLSAKTCATVVALALAAGPAVAGDKAEVPNFTLKDLAGKDVSLADLRAKGPVLVDFWATWCKPCMREIVHVEELRKHHGPQGLQVVGVSVDDTRSLAKVKSFAKTHDLGFTVLLDSNQRILKLLQGITVPYLVVVSPAGERVYAHSGYREGDEKELARVVGELMASLAPAGEGAPAGGKTGE